MKTASGFVSITPTSSLPLAGFAARKQGFERVHDDLEINGIVFQESTQAPLIVLSFDVLYVGETVTQAVKQHTLSQYGLASDRVVFVASHTHFAPNVDPSKPLLGDADAAYIAFVAQRASGLIDELMQKLKGYDDANSTVKYGTDSWFGAVNRRHPLPLFLSRTVGFFSDMGPYPAGPCNRTLHVVPVYRAEALQAVLWSVACHPVTFPRREVSADYIGVVRQHLRRQYGAIAVVFMQGFAGDIRPNVPRSWVNRKQALLHLAGLSCLVLSKHDYPGWQDWSRDLAEAVLKAVEHSHEMASTPLESACNTTPTQDLFDHLAEPHALPPSLKTHTLHLGEKRLFCVNAEVLSGYAVDLPEDVIPVSCLEDVFGYLPHPTDLPKGGYEVHRSQVYHGFRGTFKRVPVDLRSSLAA